MIKVGVFYDGNYFFRVSSYYAYGHPRKSRLSISGIHDFIRHQVSNKEDKDKDLCRIVDAHYFRGRLGASEASQRGDTLYWDRVFDDILMSENVTTHYLPVKTIDGQKQEKGIDVLLALEAFELAFYKKFDVLVLIASDGDYVPLIRKLNTLGTRVMVLSWDFEYTDDTGRKFATRTSQDLLEEATYPIIMHDLIDNRIHRNDPMINNMFVQSDFRRPQSVRATSSAIPAAIAAQMETPYLDIDESLIETAPIVQPVQPIAQPVQPIIQPVQPLHTVAQPLHTIAQPIVQPVQPIVQPVQPIVQPVQPLHTVVQPVQPLYTQPQQQPVQPIASVNPPHNTEPRPETAQLTVMTSEIMSLKDGYGFIKYPPNNLFFHYSDVIGLDFNELQIGDVVEFVHGSKEDGRGYATNVRLI